jgi:phosphatidylserine/phosphatidylglycerophosphate/cardiolipin synthase-like enzyme
MLVLQACGGTIATPTDAALATQAETEVSQPTVADTPQPVFSSIPLKAGFGFRTPGLQLYFTDPTSPYADAKWGGVDGLISAAIVAAHDSVDVALNSLGVNSVTEALIRVHNRGRKVRVVMESKNLADRANLQQLTDAGIPIVGDNQDSIMNDRFVIIDNNEVWTGSANYTGAAFFKEDNDFVRVFSPEVAADYTKEFEEMFTGDQFGPNVVPDTPYPSVANEGMQMEVLFSPDDVVNTRLIQLLVDAKESIDIMSYSFDSTELGPVIRERASHGIQVSGVLESTQVDPTKASEFDLFKKSGLDVRLGNTSEVVNHRAMIIDGKIVVTGSYDFTDNGANQDDGNLLIIHNEDVAQKYLEEFKRLQSRAQP